MTETFNKKIMEQKLHRADRKHSRLYLICNFIALMIISAYSALMCSRTVQTVFPKGGDSRKQMYAIFVMTLAGCVVFTIYAAGLFFRHKSGQLGILMAVGASGKQLLPGLFREVISLSSLSGAAGILAGFPLVWLIWSLFRLFLVDSAEMDLTMDFRCLGIPAVFFLVVVGFACLSAWRYLKKTNIMEIIREEHINEPVKEPGRWCGPVGFLIILAGAAMGYSAPLVWERLLCAYSPPWTAVLYAPVFVGLYMVMLHTVVYGWNRYGKTPCKNLISRGMMKLQAKQIVNNLLVITLLFAGAAFAIFYIPAGSVSSLLGYADYPCDYFYQYRADQKVPDREAVNVLADQYHLSVRDWSEAKYITLGVGGRAQLDDGDNRFHVEYVPVLMEAKVLSEEAYQALTGQNVDVLPGTYYYVTDRQETNVFTNESARDLTNMVTEAHLDTEFAGYLHYDLLTDPVGWLVVDHDDYECMAEGLTDEWKGHIVQFNADGEASYSFAGEFYRLFVASFDQSCEHIFDYDRVAKIMAEKRGESYWMDTERGEAFRISYENMDSLQFKMEWAYRPSFRILLINDYLRMTGVLYMMFLFIFIVCLTTALVICYTRCQTIVLNNRFLFDDLRKLGASPAFLSEEVRTQCSSVFKVPALVGLSAMYILFCLILYVNDGRISGYETVSLLICLIILLLTGMLIYGVYRRTVKEVKKQLGIGL